jgi:CheY-like chemotaxis protein
MRRSKREALTEASSVHLEDVRVLVVEDTWHVANAMKGLLEDLGMAVIGPAATLGEAERLVAAQMPQMAIIDVNLKCKMAYGLIQHLHEAAVPVIVVSGYAVPPGWKKTAAFAEAIRWTRVGSGPAEGAQPGCTAREVMSCPRRLSCSKVNAERLPEWRQVMRLPTFSRT